AKNHKIVIIEKNPHNAYSAMLEKDPATWWLKNDFTELPILQKAQLARAQRVYITTNHDLANLNALVAIQEVHQNSKNFNLYCHLGDLNLHTNLGKTLLHDPRFATVKLFNGYHVVTHRLYKNWLVNKGYLNPDGNIFIILGFGRFGQMLYSHLVADTERPGQDEMMIATLKLSFMLDLTHYDWAEVRKRDSCKIHEPFYQDIRSPGLWDKLAQQIRTAGTKSVIIFACVDDDIMNINVAIAMKLNGPEELQRATIICRTFSPMAHEINDILEKRLTSRQARDVILFPLQQELQAAFQEELFCQPEPV
ncbi:NAD-binding protein, partial [candidate division KSB1 bacterium]|nr:NAD-binding protein [candidate division KSB1 bacterium]